MTEIITLDLPLKFDEQTREIEVADVKAKIRKLDGTTRASVTPDKLGDFFVQTLAAGLVDYRSNAPVGKDFARRFVHARYHAASKIVKAIWDYTNEGEKEDEETVEVEKNASSPTEQSSSIGSVTASATGSTPRPQA